MKPLGVAFDGRNPIAVAREQARAAEAAGAATFWVSSHLFLRDPFSTAAVILEATQSARVVLMAVSPQVMHPVHIAMAAATLDELAPGRVALCMGSGAPGDLADAGVEPVRPLRMLTEAVEAVRLLLSGEPATYAGELIRLRGRRMAKGGPAIPILLAASHPRSLELAGRIADGVVLSSASSVEFVRWSLEHVERGEGQARAAQDPGRDEGQERAAQYPGRDEGQERAAQDLGRDARGGRRFLRAGLVYAFAAERPAEALGRFRRQLGITLRGAHHAQNLALAGARLDQPAVREAMDREDWAAFESLVSDDTVRRHSACGTPDELRARLDAYRAAGLDEIVLAGLYTPEETRRTAALARGDAN